MAARGYFVAIATPGRHMAVRIRNVIRRNGVGVEIVLENERTIANILMYRPDLTLIGNSMGTERVAQLAVRCRDAGLPFAAIEDSSGDEEEVIMLELGASDFIRSDATESVLMARLVRCLKAKFVDGGADTPRPIRVGPLSICEMSHVVHWHDREIILPPLPFKTLALLAKRPQQVYSRDEILDMVNKNENAVDRSVDTVVKRIRREFRAIHPDIKVPRTIYTFGYLLGDVSEFAHLGRPELVS